VICFHVSCTPSSNEENLGHLRNLNTFCCHQCWMNTHYLFVSTLLIWWRWATNWIINVCSVLQLECTLEVHCSVGYSFSQSGFSCIFALYWILSTHIIIFWIFRCDAHVVATMWSCRTSLRHYLLLVEKHWSQILHSSISYPCKLSTELSGSSICMCSRHIDKFADSSV
jgi:hypothetical protein